MKQVKNNPPDENKGLTFGIDFDGTFNADPDLFRDIIVLIKSRGHDAVIVTGRSENMGQEVKNVVGGIVPIVFAGDAWKKNAAIAMGYQIDVWVDDLPESISHQYPMPKIDFSQVMKKAVEISDQKQKDETDNTSE